MPLFTPHLACLDSAAQALRSVDAMWPFLNPSLLLATIVLPLACGLMLLANHRLSEADQRWLAGGGFLLPGLFAIWLWLSAAAGQVGDSFLFTSRFSCGLELFGIRLHLGLNGLSAPLLLLTGLVGMAVGLQGWKMPVEKARLLRGLTLIMLSGLFGIFASLDLFFLYFFHEMALIPTFIAIGVWGGRGRRTVAMEMAVYLTVGAMVALAGLLYLYTEAGVHSFDLIELQTRLSRNPLDPATQQIVFGLLLFGLGTLVSLWPFHSWAPRGYATAPVGIAMLHAGVLKKFGLYTLAQVALPLLPLGRSDWNQTLLWLALGNVLVIGLVTISQRDLKLMIGHGSVMHMGYAFAGLASLTILGTGGMIFFLFAHGLSVALLFLLADGVERRTGTTDMTELGGLARPYPLLAGYFVAATLAALGLPGFANFWGELAIFTALFKLYPVLTAAFLLGIVISAVYGLRAATRVFFGEERPPALSKPAGSLIAHDLCGSEKAGATLLLAALLIVGFFPRGLTEGIDRALRESNAVQTTCVNPPSRP